MRELRLALADASDVAAGFHAPAASSGAAASRAPVLLLPGARGDHAAEHLVTLATLLAAAGHPVVRAALSSRPPGAGVVGPAERSVPRARAVLDAARTLVSSDASDAPNGWIIGGASYGGRVASLAVAEDGGAALGVVGLLLVAYPLHPPGGPDRLRVAHWDRVDVPVLMLSGDADPFLTIPLLDEHVGTFAGPCIRLILPGGRHDLSVSSRSAPDGIRRSPKEAVESHADGILAWAAAR